MALPVLRLDVGTRNEREMEEALAMFANLLGQPSRFCRSHRAKAVISGNLARVAISRKTNLIDDIKERKQKFLGA